MKKRDIQLIITPFIILNVSDRKSKSKKVSKKSTKAPVARSKNHEKQSNIDSSKDKPLKTEAQSEKPKVLKKKKEENLKPKETDEKDKLVSKIILQNLN